MHFGKYIVLLPVSKETAIDGTKTKTHISANTCQGEKVEYAKVNKPKKHPTPEKTTIDTQPPVPAGLGEVEEDDKNDEGEASYQLYCACLFTYDP